MQSKFQSNIAAILWLAFFAVLPSLLCRPAIAAEKLTLVCEYGPYSRGVLTPLDLALSPLGRTKLPGGSETFHIEDDKYLNIQGVKIKSSGENNKESFFFRIIRKDKKSQHETFITINRFSGAYTVIEIRYSPPGPPSEATYHDVAIREGHCRPGKKLF